MYVNVKTASPTCILRSTVALQFNITILQRFTLQLLTFMFVFQVQNNLNYYPMVVDML